MSRSRTALRFAMLAVFWGGSFVAIEVGLGGIPPVLFAALRFDLASLVLLPYLALTTDDWLPRTAADRRAVLAGGLFVVALNNGLLFLGQRFVSPGAGAILYALNPVLTPAFAWLLLGEGLGFVDAGGLLLALCGVALVARPSPGALAGSLGPALLVGAATSVALGGVLLRRIDADRSSVVVTGWSMALGALCLHAASLARGEALAVRITPAVVASMAYVGVFATAMAYAFYFALIDEVGPVRTNLASYVVPVVAAVAGWALLGETLSPLSVVGFLVVFAGFVVVQRDVFREVVSRVRSDHASTAD